MKTHDLYWMIFKTEQGVVRKKVSGKLFVESTPTQTYISLAEVRATKIPVTGMAHDPEEFYYNLFPHEFGERLNLWKVDGQAIFYSVESEGSVAVLAECLARVGVDKLFE